MSSLLKKSEVRRLESHQHYLPKEPLHTVGLKRTADLIEAGQAKLQERWASFEEEMTKARLEILDSARREAADILDKARKEAEEIREHARQEGRQSGYDEGYDDGYDKGSQEAKVVLEQAEAILEAAFTERNRRLEQLEKETVELAIAVAAAVLGEKALVDEQIVQAAAKKALQAAHGTKKAVLRVNPRDSFLVSELIHEFRYRVEVVSDDDIERGGCIIETDTGSYDATLSSQIRRITERLREIA